MPRIGPLSAVCVVLTALLLTPWQAAAGQAQVAAATQALARLQAERGWPRRHFWRVEINGRESVAVAVPVLERSADDFWMRVADLRAWDIELPDTTARIVDDEAYAPLSALPLLAQRVDTQEGVIYLRLPPRAFERATLSAAPQTAPPVSPPIAGALVNYDGFVARNESNRESALQSNLLLSAQAFHGRRRVVTRWIARDDRRRSEALRLETAFRYDDRERAVQLSVGDAVARGGALAPQLRFGGVQWRRDFAIRPQERPFPLPAFEGTAELPSTVDLFIDQARRMRETVSSGPFEIVQPPVVSGGGEAQLVVTDSLGRQRRIRRSFYVNSQALQPGLSDFGFALGALRRGYGQRSYEYGGLLANAFYRRGLTRSLTAEVFGRQRSDRSVAGGAMTATLADWAVLDAGALHARSDAAQGWSAQVGLRRTVRQWNASLRARASEAGFGAGLERNPDVRWEAVAQMSRSLGRVRVGLRHVVRERREGGDFARSALDVRFRFGRGPSVAASLFHQRIDADDDTGLRLILTQPFGGGRTLSASATASDDRPYQTRLARRKPGELGTDWRVGVSGQRGRDPHLQAEVGQSLPWLRYRLQADRSGQRSALAASAAGSVGVLGDKVFASRPVDDAVGLVRVPGLAGVPVYRDNRLVGHTDRGGALVLPGLRGYQRHNIRIGTRNLPMDVRVRSGDGTLVPPRQSAARMTFEAKHIRSVQFRAVRADGTPVPAGARILVDDKAASVPVARDGLVYLENVGRASLRVQLRWRSGGCAVMLRVPDTAGALTDLGRQPCQ